MGVGGEAGEDMWHLFNLIRAGDQVTATTFRKVQVGGMHTATSERIKLKLTISVEAIDFEPEGKLAVRSLLKSSWFSADGWRWKA